MCALTGLPAASVSSSQPGEGSLQQRFGHGGALCSSSSVSSWRSRRVQQEQRGVSAPSSDHAPRSSLSHDGDSSLALRAAEQEMNSTHSFPKFPSPPPPPPPPVPPTLPPSTGQGLVGNVVLMKPPVPSCCFSRSELGVFDL